MNKPQKSRFIRPTSAFCGMLGVFAFYIATVGLVPAASRHAQDGRLQWLSPGALKTLQAYEWPASYLAKVPGIRTLLESSADFWCAATRAPETT